MYEGLYKTNGVLVRKECREMQCLIIPSTHILLLYCAMNEKYNIQKPRAYRKLT